MIFTTTQLAPKSAQHVAAFRHGEDDPPVLRDLAYQRIMGDIFLGRIRQGSLVSQRDLCAATSLPISAVRESLKRLEAEGVVKLIPRRGVLIRHVDANDIRDLFQLREAMEVFAVRFYAQNRDSREIAALRQQTLEAIELQKNAGAEDINAAFRARIAADERMHEVIIRSLGNPLFEAAYEPLLRTARLSRLDVLPEFVASAPSLQEHLAVVDAVEAGDADAAARAMQIHLRNGLDRALRTARRRIA